MKSLQSRNVLSENVLSENVGTKFQLISFNRSIFDKSIFFFIFQPEIVKPEKQKFYKFFVFGIKTQKRTFCDFLLLSYLSIRIQTIKLIMLENDFSSGFGHL